MERLTGYDYIGGAKIGDLLVGVDPLRAFDRLAAYEDICFDADGKERITVEELTALVKTREE